MPKRPAVAPIARRSSVSSAAPTAAKTEMAAMKQELDRMSALFSGLSMTVQQQQQQQQLQQMGDAATERDTIIKQQKAALEAQGETLQELRERHGLMQQKLQQQQQELQKLKKQQPPRECLAEPQRADPRKGKQRTGKSVQAPTVPTVTLEEALVVAENLGLPTEEWKQQLGRRTRRVARQEEAVQRPREQQQPRTAAPAAPPKKRRPEAIRFTAASDSVTYLEIYSKVRESDLVTKNTTRQWRSRKGDLMLELKSSASGEDLREGLRKLVEDIATVKLLTSTPTTVDVTINGVDMGATNQTWLPPWKR